MRVLFWFRKDLRLEDNTGLVEAVGAGDVFPFYASEPEILGRDDMAPIRVQFVLDALSDLSESVRAAGSRLILDHGTAEHTVLRAARAVRADAVYWNNEYEPALIERDARVEAALTQAGVAVRRFDDRLLVPPDAVLTRNGTPYTVFTPFARACEALPLSRPLEAVRRLASHEVTSPRVASLARLGFATDVPTWPGGTRAAGERLVRFAARHADYAEHRDRPDLEATSCLSADLKFGTLSPRTIAAAVLDAPGERRSARSAQSFLRQLRWRDFYAYVMYHFPHTEHSNFRPQYDDMVWQGDPDHFDAWADGRTGFPIVDAGMRQLRTTGYMHNRVRMIAASFLTKDLLLDWRLGARHFMRHLVDGDLANNNGGWQWAASTGTDAQPYFRVFNPALQGARFDPQGDYVRRWVPELAGLPARWIHRPAEAPEAVLAEADVRLGERYPHPLVDHAERRRAAIEMFQA